MHNDGNNECTIAGNRAQNLSNIPLQIGTSFLISADKCTTECMSSAQRGKMYIVMIIKQRQRRSLIITLSRSLMIETKCLIYQNLIIQIGGIS